MTVDLTELVSEILRDSREMVLATVSEKGPWAATLVFGSDKDYHLFWTSHEDARHSLELTKNPLVAATITKQPTGGGQDKGLQIEGKAYKLENDDEILGAAREFYMKRGSTDLPETIDEVEPYNPESSWYVLKPDKIFVIYEPLFAHDRQEFIP